MSKSKSSEKRNRGKLFVGNYLLFITVSKAAPQGPKIPAMFALEQRHLLRLLNFHFNVDLSAGNV